MTQDNKNTEMEKEEILENANQNEEIPESLPDNEEITKLREALARSQADYQNMMMRAERDRKDMQFFLTEKLMRGLLPQIDHLDRAVSIKNGVEGDAFVDGVRSVQTGLKKYLESNGVIAFDSIGQEVDADRHEVLSQMPGEEGKILQEFEKGYMFGDRVLRHAKVVVGSGE